MKKREAASFHEGRPVIEGAGVHLRRVFGYREARSFDPFLMLDDFRSERPGQYLPGFPWHPHRGIETITYMLEGTVEHGDSMGNSGTIGPGGVQWMTAGGGVIHQEMPKGDGSGRMGGFQLWANLPASSKMMAPRYREVASGSIPEVRLEDGVSARVVAGTLGGVTGPVRDVVTDPEYFDVTLAPGGRFIHPTAPGHTVFAYVSEGRALIGDLTGPSAVDGTAVLLEDGDLVEIHAGDGGARFLLAAGRPLREPIAWEGPIVMNTPGELRLAFSELERGTFIRRA